MSDVTVMFTLTDDTLAALKIAARQDHCDVGSFLRRVLTRELHDRDRPAKPPLKRVLAAPLRALLSDDFALADTWNDLQDRLGAKGYVLRQTQGALCLHAAGEAQPLFGTSEFGASAGALSRRFSEPFPGVA